MTLAITSTNPFVKSPLINPINKVEAKNAQQAEKTNDVASNPIKQTSPEKAEQDLKKYSDCVSNYAKAMIAMQGSGQSQAGANQGGMVGTETSGTVG